MRRGRVVGCGEVGCTWTKGVAKGFGELWTSHTTSVLPRTPPRHSPTPLHDNTDLAQRVVARAHARPEAETAEWAAPGEGRCGTGPVRAV
eukprot:1014891-Rhodomonas_salina.2